MNRLTPSQFEQKTRELCAHLARYREQHQAVEAGTVATRWEQLARVAPGPVEVAQCCDEVEVWRNQA